MKAVYVGIASAFVVALPLTASSASAQARVEVDEWWETEPALEQSWSAELDHAPGIDELDIVDEFYGDAGWTEPVLGTAYREDPRARTAVEGRVGYVDPRGRVAVDVGRDRFGWGARVVVLDRSRRLSYRPLWRTVRWNVRLDTRRGDRFDGYLDRRELRDILGRGTLERLERHADRIGAYGQLSGRWTAYDRRGRVLQIRAGRTPVAELIAFGRDRRVDVVRLNARRFDDRYDRYDDRYRDGRYDDARYYDDDRYYENRNRDGRRDDDRGRGRGRGRG